MHFTTLYYAAYSLNFDSPRSEMFHRYFYLVHLYRTNFHTLFPRTNRLYYWPVYGPVLFCWLASVVVCRRHLQRSRRAGRPAAGRVGGRAADTTRRASTVTFC